LGGSNNPARSFSNVKVANRRLGVAIVAASPRWIGGQGVQADLLVRDWLNDPEVSVRFIPIDPILPSWLRWVERIPVARTFARAPLYFAQLFNGTRNVDVVHIFCASYSSFLISALPAWMIAVLLRKKTLFHYHSGEAQDHLRRSWVARRVLGQAEIIVVPSQYLANVFREFGLVVQAIPNVVHSSQFRYRVRQPLLPRLVCTRGFHPYYSVDVVVRAFDLLKKAYPDARLCLVGKGPIEKQIRELVLGLELQDVAFTGPVAHSEIAHYYDQNDIFMNASWVDNMPVSILEAFASGTPVVTTAPEGIRYLVEHERTGLLCEPGDYRALSENVTRLLQDPQFARQLAANAYEESRRYQWELVRKQWLDFYRSLTTSEKTTERVLAIGEK
jgi:glycosyltransferase involved in cell wall biosynthesis